MLRVDIDFEIIITLAEEGLQSVRRLLKVNFYISVACFPFAHLPCFPYNNGQTAVLKIKPDNV